MQITGTQLFVKALLSEGVDTLFAYPGGCVIAIFDELYKQNDIELILPRHEQALIHAADGYARSTGKVGVCLVTSGPGATNIVTGIATANYDSVPLVCFTGQVKTGLIGNDAFQEVDIVGITRTITKHSIVVTDRKDLGKVIKEAFYIARTGKPGPVVVDLPTDVMAALGSPDYPENVTMRSYKPNVGIHLGQLKRAISYLMDAKRPLFLAGGGINVANACKEFTDLVNQTQVPVVTTIMGRGAIATDHPLYVGNLGMHGSYAANHAIAQCDVLFCIGTRFNDRITGDTRRFAPNAKIIHIDIDPAAISRTIKVDIPIVSDAKKAIEALLELTGKIDTSLWIEQIKNWKEEFPLEMAHVDGLSPFEILKQINECFPNAVIATDVGQHQMWATQYIEITDTKKLLTSGGLGTMGYGFPASIGAQIGNLDKRVVCITGDGGFQMNLQELATAVSEELPLVVVIFNNGYLGMVRQWQEIFYGARYSSTCMRHRRSCRENCHKKGQECPPYIPDFVKLAQSYGAIGIRVTKNEQIEDALKIAKQSKKVPVIIECILSPELNVLPMVAPGNPIDDMILEVDL